jgi:hypothetical protein
MLHKSATYSRLFSLYTEDGCRMFVPDVAEFVSDWTWSHTRRRWSSVLSWVYSVLLSGRWCRLRQWQIVAWPRWQIPALFCVLPVMPWWFFWSTITSPTPTALSASCRQGSWCHHVERCDRSNISQTIYVQSLWFLKVFFPPLLVLEARHRTGMWKSNGPRAPVVIYVYFATGQVILERFHITLTHVFNGETAFTVTTRG